MEIRPAYLVAFAAVAVAVLYASRQGTTTYADMAQGVGAGVVDIIGNTTAGAVVEIGKGVGIPATDKTECEKAMAEGRTWDASFACPAGTFLNYLIN